MIVPAPNAVNSLNLHAGLRFFAYAPMKKTAAPSRLTSAFNWDDLRYFLELARRGRLAIVARHFGVEHTTVSRRIAELEAVLDEKLFDRAESGHTLTAMGEKLLRYAEQMEVGAYGVADAAGITHARSETVRLVTMEGIGGFYIAPRLARLKAQQPHLMVELVTSPQLGNLTRREADVMLSFTRPDNPGVVVRKIGWFSLRLYAGADYLAAHGLPMLASDLKQHVFVDYIDELVSIPAVRWLRDAVPAPNIVFRSTSMAAHQNAAAGGLGIALLPSFTAIGDERLRPVLHGQIEVRRDLWLATHEHSRKRPKIVALMDFIRRQIEADSAFLQGKKP
jgi:DNA-binding transcriptional LysR family regulator